MGSRQRWRPCTESEGEAGMKTILNALKANSEVSGYKINVKKKDSFELFFVKGKLETVRCTDTCDKEVTVYVDHADYMGDAQFFVYPSTTEQQLNELVAEAVAKAKLIRNKPYALPEAQTEEYAVESNFPEFSPEALAVKVAKTVFAANNVENATLNSVEVFINKHTDTVVNSRGLNKTQVRYTAMMEAIPTYNGETQSVELYEQYNFSSLDEDALAEEIVGMMLAAKARYEAVKPEKEISCKVILNKLEISQLMQNIVRNLNYGMVYAHASVFQKGTDVQRSPAGDRISITMAGQAKGCVGSSMFDDDGLTLGSICVVDNGKACAYFGDNRHGQYLGETPTGNLRCICVAPGTAEEADLSSGPYLEVVSMSGLQLDFFSDYIGGEVRLAYYHDGEKTIPVTGISISGQVSHVLNSIRLSASVSAHDSYVGPEKAILSGMKIY